MSFKTSHLKIVQFPVYLFFIVLLLLSTVLADEVEITFQTSTESPFVINVADSGFVRFDVNFGDANFDSLFLHIPDKPDFFTFWRERRIKGPGNFIYDKIVFKPKSTDGGQYIFAVIAGGIRKSGEVVSDTLFYEVRVKPFVFQEPEFTGGTRNTIYWMQSEDLYDQWIYIFDGNNPATPASNNALAKATSSNVIQTTFENLQHGVRYGYFIKGFTQDGTETFCDTVYSTQDAVPPDFVSSSRGFPGIMKTADLYWNPVTDQDSYVAGYLIYRRRTGEGFVTIDSVFVDKQNLPPFYHYIDSPSDLIEGETYYYKIVAFDAGLNSGDGVEVGPIVADATPPNSPTFFWEKGYGFEYVLDHPIRNLPQMGYTEKTWFNRGKGNTVFLYNPNFLSGFSGLAKADSVQFQAVRDSSKFFVDEWQPGMQFFDKWSSPWIAIDDFSDSLVFYTFDFSNNGQNDDWFIHDHFYKFRAQFKDKAGNKSNWSRLNSENLLVGAYQDLVSPADIKNLDLFLKFDDQFGGGGYFRLNWEKATDPVSGVGWYRVYRRTGDNGQFQLIDSVKATDASYYQYFDPFDQIDKRDNIYYRILATDNVGNARAVENTNWQVSGLAPLAPVIAFSEQLVEIDGTLYTTRSVAGINWNGYNINGVSALRVFVNADSQQIDATAMQYDVPLVEGENRISARALFDDGSKSPKSNVLVVKRDSTPPTPVTSLTAMKDSIHTGNIYLDWSESQDLLAVRYLIYRKEKGAANFSLLDSTTSTEYIDPYIHPNDGHLKAFQHYEYRVVAQDTLWNSSEQDANIAETYCNVAPNIIQTSFFADSIAITWNFPSYPDSNRVPMDSIRYDVKIFQNDLPKDITTDVPYRVDYVVGSAGFQFKIDPGPIYYAFVRAVELTSTNLDSSAWSLPKFTDTGKSIIPPIDTLFTQAQPTDTTGIYVSWDSYWQHPFWNDHLQSIVGYIEVRRWLQSDPGTVLKRIYDTNSTEFTNSGFMDDQALVANEEYVYQATPYEKKVNDPPRFVPAGNQQYLSVNDTSQVKNATDRIFIPKLDNTANFNPKTGKNYFHYFVPDSLKISWFWLYESQTEEQKAKNGDFRGAEKVALYVSNNAQFEHQPAFKKYTGIKEINRKSLADDSLFYFNYVTGLINPNTFNIYEGKSVYIKIKGFDRWGHDPKYPSSLEFDGKSEYVLDNTVPTDPKLSFYIRSSMDTLSDKNLVDIYFSWSKSTDNMSGLRDYSIKVSRKDEPDSVIIQIDNIAATDTLYKLKRFEIKDGYFQYPLEFQIFPRDFAGNINRNTQKTDFKFFTPPEILKVVRDTLTNNVQITWTKVPAADKYLIVFASKKSYFIDENLRMNPGNREEIIVESSYPDTIQKTLEKYYNPDSTWYFRMTAVKANIYESGWSNFYELPASSNTSSGDPITSTTDRKELPTAFRLRQNYPNPFPQSGSAAANNPTTTIEYEIPSQTHVEILVYNTNGELVRTLVSRDHQVGQYNVVWNGRNNQDEVVASGMYFYVIKTPQFRQVKKCLFLK